MASSDSLILLPPRHTAQAMHDALKNPKHTTDDSFAPELEKATKAKRATKHIAITIPLVKGTAPKPLAAKAADDTQIETTAVDQPTAENELFKQQIPKLAESPEEPQSTATTLAQTGASAITETATTVPVQKKPAKLQRTAAKSEVQPKQPIVDHSVPKQVSDLAKQPETLAEAAVATPQANAGNMANTDTSDTDSTAPTIASTRGFYGGGSNGSAKVIPRATVDPDQSASTESAADLDGTPAQNSADPSAGDADLAANLDAELSVDGSASKSPATTATSNDFATVFNSLATPSTVPAAINGNAAVRTSPQANFVEQNHPKIVTGITGQLMPKGGTLQIRLDPPDLGALQVTVHLKEGVMTASFETSNDDATKLLSRSLGQLKSGLEAAGVSVEKLHVEQAPKQNNQQNGDSSSKQSTQDQQRQAQQDQQRREMVQRMWRKLAGGDPLDLVA